MLTDEDRERLAVVLNRMKATSDQFYRSAVGCGNHAFIEFCGLMNEYIKVCETAVGKGIDFTQASTHTGVSLPFEPYHRDYLYDKLDCIYGPSLAGLLKASLEKGARQESLFPEA